MTTADIIALAAPCAVMFATLLIDARRWAERRRESLTWERAQRRRALDTARSIAFEPRNDRAAGK